MPSEIRINRCWYWRQPGWHSAFGRLLRSLRNPLITYTWRCASCDGKPTELYYTRGAGRRAFVHQQSMKHALWYHCPKTWLGSSVTNPDTAATLAILFTKGL